MPLLDEFSLPFLVAFLVAAFAVLPAAAFFPFLAIFLGGGGGGVGDRRLLAAGIGGRGERLLDRRLDRDLAFRFAKAGCCLARDFLSGGGGEREDLVFPRAFFGDGDRDQEGEDRRLLRRLRLRKLDPEESDDDEDGDRLLLAPVLPPLFVRGGGGCAAAAAAVAATGESDLSRLRLSMM